jgi:energy-coupling factor transporter ATP-binding protein EcfA2
MRSSAPYGSSLAAHVPPSRLSTAPADKHSLSDAPSRLTTTGSSYTALYDLPAAVVPRASCTVLSGDKPGYALSSDALCWSSIGGLNELGGVSIAETFIDEEGSKRPAKRPSSDPEGELSNKRVCHGGGSESDEAAELLAVWGSVARHDQALDGVATSLDMFYSSPTAVEEWDENDHLVPLRRFREELGPVPDVPRDMAHLEFLSPVALSPHEPDSKPPAQSLASPSSPVARGTSIPVNSSSVPAISTVSPLQEEEMVLSSAEMQSLLSKKLANPDHALNDQENITLLTHCVAEGERNAEKIKGKDVLVVMGNKGAGKSTFLNYLLGCEMIQKTPKELGITGVSKVVVVKAKSEGGCLDEVMAIGHAEVPKTVIPQIEIDHFDVTVAYCDCPGFLDDRGAAINIASVVNIRRVLQSARSTKVLILINYHSVSSDRGQGLHDMLKICTQLFGSSSQLSHHKDSLLLGITRVPSDEANLSDLREWLLENTSDVLTFLYDNLFLYDPLDSGLGDYLSRSACIEALSKLKSIPRSASSRLFQTVLTDSDECELVKIVESQSASLRSLLDAGYYAQAASRWRALERLRAIDNIRVERLLHTSENCLRSSFSKLEIAFKEACCCNFPRSEGLLNTLSQIAGCFSAELCRFSLPTLRDYHSKSRARHAEHERQSDKEKRALEHEYAEKLLAARKEKEALEQAYQELLRGQRTPRPASQSSLTPRIVELSRRQAAEQQQLQSLCTPAMAFGVEEWRQYYGEVGSAPDLPSDIDDILDSACPFWSSRKIRDTHLLVLIPAKVNGQLFSLNLLRELIQHPNNGGYKTQYRCYDSDLQAQLGAASPTASYWLLITRDVLPESRSKKYADQKELVTAHASRVGLPYELPKALEAAAAILAHHVRGGERLYGDNPWTYTCCQEWIFHGSNEYPAVVGGFESSGLFVYYFCAYSGYYDGVAGCRKFQT